MQRCMLTILHTIASTRMPGGSFRHQAVSLSSRAVLYEVALSLSMKTDKSSLPVPYLGAIDLFPNRSSNDIAMPPVGRDRMTG